MIFSVLRTERITDQVRKTAHAVQKFPLPRPLIIGRCRFHQMPSRVEFMAFTQVGPPFLWIVDGKISINIAVLLLRPGDQVDDFIRRTFQLPVRTVCQRKSHRLQPFGNVRILKDRPVEFPFFQSCRNPEIFQTVAGLGVLDPIIHHIPLIGDNRTFHQVHMRGPEGILYFNLF